jgi:hypothetical protein
MFEETYIKKKLLIIGVSILLTCIVGLSGCVSNENNTEEDKIVGTWVDEESMYRMYKFFSDGTCLINTYELEGTYYLTETTVFDETRKTLIINQTSPAITYTYTYHFSGDVKLILESETERILLTKQE